MSKFRQIRTGAIIKMPTQQGDRFNVPNSSIGKDELRDLSVSVKKLRSTDIVVGTILDVNNGDAHFSSIQAAHDAAAASGKIILLATTITETVTWTKSDLLLEGKGRGSVLTGNFTVSGSGNILKCLKVSGNVVLSGDGNFVSEAYIAATFTLSDTGTGNQTTYIQES